MDPYEPNCLSVCLIFCNSQLKGDAMSKEMNVVYIGSKPVMSYVLAVMTGLSNTDSKEIVLKARGRAISSAVDVAEVARRKFIKELEVTKISIGTEEVQTEEGGKRAVSTMEIVLTKSAAQAST